MARERLHQDLPLPSNEIDDIARGSEAKPQEGDRKLLLYLAQKMAGTRSRRTVVSN